MVDHNGAPVSAVQVAVVAADQHPLAATTVLTSPNGFFTIDSLPSAPASIGVIGRPGVAESITSVEPGQREVVLTLKT